MGTPQTATEHPESPWVYGVDIRVVKELMRHESIATTEIYTRVSMPKMREAQLAASTPPGFDLVSAPVAMRAGSAVLTAVGTFARRDEVREVHGATRAELLAQVPDGWHMLYTLGE